MRVVATAPGEAPLVSFELVVEAPSQEEARQIVAHYGAARLQPPFIEALGMASEDDLSLLTRVSQLGSKGIDCVVVEVTGAAPRFTVKLTAYPRAVRRP